MSTFGHFTVARTSVKRVLNASGVLAEVAANTPALEFNADGSYRGTLVEPAATNLALRSEEFDNAYWTKAFVSVTANNAVAPDGTTTAERFTDSAGSNFTNSNTITVASGAVVALSMWAKKDTTGDDDFLRVILRNSSAPSTDFIFVYFNIKTGAVGSNSVGGAGVFTTASARVDAYPNGWYRCSFSGSMTGITTYQVAFASATADNNTNRGAGSQWLLWGAQLETGAVATSYIPTVASTATRTADSVTLTGASSLIGQGVGTMFAEFVYRGAPVNRSGPLYLRQANLRGLSINYASSVAGIEVVSRNDTATTFITIVAGVLQIGTTYKVAVVYNADGTAAGGTKVNGITCYVNGVSVATGNFNVPDVASLNEVRLYGANSGTDADAFNGSLRNIALFSTALTSAQAIALTSP